MWLRNGDRVVLVPDTMPDTITRCLRDGWVETTDPRTVVEPQPATAAPMAESAIPEPVLEPEGAPADEPASASEPEPKAKRG